MKLILNDSVFNFKKIFTESISSGPEVATKKISPSGLECQVAVWYKLHGIEMLPEERSFESDGYASSGDSRHKTIQRFLASNDKIEWVDIAKYVEDHNLPFEVEYEARVLDLSKKFGLTCEQVCELIGSYERLLKHKNGLINFKLDGIVKYDGEYYILEIKTASKVNCAKAPLSKHQLQGKTYSMLLNIPKLIWVYESREDFKHTIVFQEFTEEDIIFIKNYLNTIVLAKDPKNLKRSSDCKYCRYREHCLKEFNNESIF